MICQPYFDKFTVPARERKRRRPVFTFPEDINWNQTYSALAKVFGCSIGQIRLEFVRRFPGRDKPKFILFPNDIDWSQTFDRLAIQFGCSPATIRKEYKRRHPGERKKSGFQFPEDIDWLKPFHVLGAEFGVSGGYVRQEFLRRFPGQKKHIRTTPEHLRPKWQKFKAWDWTLIDGQLARVHGISRERARQIRKGLGLPSSKELWVVDWSTVDWTKSDHELAEYYGRGHGLIHSQRERVAPETIPPAVDMEAKWHARCATIPDALYNSLTLPQLQKLLPDVPHHRLFAYRRKHGFAIVKPRGRYKGTDWTQSNKVIAARLGVHTYCVQNYRKKYYPETIQDRDQRPVNVKYANVDWTRSDKELSAYYGIAERSMQNVRTWWKKKNGLPLGRWKKNSHDQAKAASQRP